MPLTVGDPAPWFVAHTSRGGTFKLESVAGRWVCLVFANDPSVAAEAAAAISKLPQAQDWHHCILGMVRAGLDHSMPGERWFPDPEGALASRFGIDASGWVLLDAMLRVYATGALASLPASLERLAALPPPHAHADQEIAAPVLMLPRVFEPALCERLIGYYRRSNIIDSGFMREIDGRQQLVNDAQYKRRKDVLIGEPALQQVLARHLKARLIPELRKSFQYQPTRIERYLLACYEAGAGYFRAHRDNTGAATAHRKFAVTINLNTGDYDGGALWFPEFSQRLYRPPAGGAIVFSGSLMHEVTPVTRGERFAFLTFLYDETGAQQRREAHHLGQG
ncbi:MAG: 2OG-Fe(II) oxygenase [Comamonadaceae bacterium]|nr:MAG: 2OG-Fe(II) oxygenase [Comamonadaceae bacterium]